MSDIYIKMVLALPGDFFKDWNWKKGDQFILKEDKKHKIHSLGDSVLYNNRPYDLEVTTDDIADNFFDAVPLPSQRQLQEMLINFHMTHNGFSRKRAILHVMGWWAETLIKKHDFEWEKIERNEDYEEFGNPEDFDILMLKFTVGTILMNEWNGEKWV